MSYYAISALVNFFTSLILGAFVFVGQKKNKDNYSFLFFSFSVAFWSFGYYFWQTSVNAPSALFWSRFLMAGAIFIPATYLHFVYTFLDLIKKRIKFLIFTYLLFFVFFLSNFTPFFVSGVRPILDFNFWPQPGVIFHIFLVAWAFYVIYTTLILFRHYIRSSNNKHQQIGVVLTGMILGYVGGSTNYFLWYGLPVMPLGNIFVSFYVISVAYAVIRFKFLDVKVIATQVFAVLLVLITLTDIFSAKSTSDLIIRITIFLVTSIFAILLIKLILIEVNRREAMEKLTYDLQKVTKNLNKANSELKRLDQAKLEFLSIASHQLRTPLTIIKGYVSMMLEGSFGKLPKLIKENLKKVYLSNERLINLVESLLNISRIESGRLEFDLQAVDLIKIIEPIIDGFKKKIDQKNLKLEFLPDKRLPKVLTDPQKIKEVLSRLIDNAIKYTNEGKIVIGLHQEGQSVVFSCQDTGIGIPPENLPQLFEKFVQKDNISVLSTENTGLGLYFSKMVVENMGGRIWAESGGQNKGSKFYFSLPIASRGKSNKLVSKI